MLWLHLSWVVLLLGAQLSFYVQNPDYLRLGQRAESLANALRERLALSAMLLVGRDFGDAWTRLAHREPRGANPRAASSARARDRIA